MESVLENNIEVIKISGNYISDLDHKALIEKVDESINNGTHNFVIDMEGINFINSSGLSVLIRVLTKARTKGGEAVLSSIPSKVNELLVMTKLNNVFKSFTTDQEAVASLS